MTQTFNRVMTEPLVLEDSAMNQAVDLNQNNWQPFLTENQLSDIFDKGHSVNIFLRPSKNISNRQGAETYIENYALPMLLREGDKYIAMTNGNHASGDIVADVMKGARSYYIYSNCGAGFMNMLVQFASEEAVANLNIMNLVRYEEIKWIVKDTHDLLFEGKIFAGNIDIVKAIKAGKDFRIALTLPDGREFRMEVDLLFYFPESKMMNGYTETSFYPSCFGSPKEFDNYCRQEFLNEDGYYRSEMAKDGRDLAIRNLFWIYEDGTYSNAFMKAHGEKKSYSQIKIFASKI